MSHNRRQEPTPKGSSIASYADELKEELSVFAENNKGKFSDDQNKVIRKFLDLLANVNLLFEWEESGRAIGTEEVDLNPEDLKVLNDLGKLNNSELDNLIKTKAQGANGMQKSINAPTTVNNSAEFFQRIYLTEKRRIFVMAFTDMIEKYKKREISSDEDRYDKSFAQLFQDNNKGEKTPAMNNFIELLSGARSDIDANDLKALSTGALSQVIISMAGRINFQLRMPELKTSVTVKDVVEYLKKSQSLEKDNSSLRYR